MKCFIILLINYVDCRTAVAWTNKVNTNAFDASGIFLDDNVIMFFCLTTSHLDVDRDVCLVLVFFRRWGRLGPVQHYVWRWFAVIGAFRSGFCYPVRCFPHASPGLPRTAGFL